MNLPLLKGCSIVGVFWGAYAYRDPDGNRANFTRLLDWAAQGIIEPRISARFRLESLSTIASRRSNRQIRSDSLDISKWMWPPMGFRTWPGWPDRTGRQRFSGSSASPPVAERRYEGSTTTVTISAPWYFRWRTEEA